MRKHSRQEGRMAAQRPGPDQAKHTPRPIVLKPCVIVGGSTLHEEVPEKKLGE